MSHSVPLKSWMPFSLLVERVDLLLLLADALRRQAVGDGQRLRVVADAEVLAAQLLGGLGHLFERVPPSLQSVWQWKTPWMSSASTSVGQRVLLGRVDLAGVLAQLRRDVVQVRAP